MKPALLFATALLLASATSPAHALMCYGQSDGDGVVINFGLRVGEDFTESERNDFALMQLRQAGVDATRVERWNGCLRAYVRTPGGEEMQFFEPGTLRRVQ